MPGARCSKYILYEQLAAGTRKKKNQSLTFKDAFPQSIKNAAIDLANWENLTSDRSRKGNAFKQRQLKNKQHFWTSTSRGI